MREIKFRAWSKYQEFMFNWKDIFLGGSVTLKDEFDGFEKYGFILMQYTGLKDKNGVEIYEGDIVRFDLYKGERVEVIEWENIAKHTSFGGGTHNATIIGNIYENPDLLTK